MNHRWHLLFAWTLLCWLLGAVPAHAVTRFLSPYSRAAEMRWPAVYYGGLPIVPPRSAVSVVGNDGKLSYRRLDLGALPGGFTPWRYDQGPAGQDLFVLTGVVATQQYQSWSPQMFVVSAPQGGSGAARIWMGNWSSGPTGTPTWRDISSSGGPDLSNSPQISAMVSTSGAWIAVRTAGGEVWSCRLLSPTSDCTWERESCRGATGCHYAKTTGPVKAHQSAAGGLEIFSLNEQTGELQRYRYIEDSWDVIGNPPSSVTTDDVAIETQTLSGETRVFVMAWDGVSVGDALWVASSYGSNWWWWRLELPEGPPPGGYDRRLHALSYDAESNRLAFVSVFGEELDLCTPPSSSPPDGSTGFCQGWDNYHVQPDEQWYGRDGLGAGILATPSYVLVPGTLAGATYQYGYRIGAAATAWADFLAPRDAAVTLQGNGNRVEFDGDAHHGTVAVIGNNSSVWMSTDDGNSWSAPVSPVTASSGDPSLGFMGSGDLLVAAQDLPPGASALGVRIVRRSNATGQWGTQQWVPSSVTFNGQGQVTGGLNFDRPWLRVDPTQDNVALLLFAGTDGNGKFTYCNGSGDCADGSAARWCGLYNLPGNCRFVGGCALAISSITFSSIYGAYEPRYWVAVDGDSGCPTAQNGYSDQVGVRYITNGDQLPAPAGGCATPIWSAPYCISYRKTAYATTDTVNNPPTFVAQLRNGGNGPAADRRWAFTMTGAPDEHAVSLSLQVYRDIATGGPCRDTSGPGGQSANCRTEIAVIRIRQSDIDTCASPPCTVTASSFLANRDQTTNAMGQLPWVDHIMGQHAHLAGGQIGVSWLDFRDDVLNDTQYQIATNAMWFDPTSSPSQPSSFSEYLWTLTGSSTWVPNAPTGSGFGDVYYAAASPLHAHFVVPWNQAMGGGAVVVPRVAIWSPQSPQE